MKKRIWEKSAVLCLALLAVLTSAGCGSSSSSSSGNATATPTLSPGGGTYNTSQTVTIADSTANAVLYCTTDGTTPTTSSPKCAQPTTVFKSEFLQAIAAAPGKDPSAVASAGYTINLNAAATPTFSPAGGSVSTGQTVTIADATTGANIYYTTDGSVPTASSTLYTVPLTISSAQTISAIAVASGYTNSGVASAAYTIATGPAVPTPTFTPASGATIAAGQTVTIADGDANAAIYYTTDGSMPSASSAQYTAPVALSTPGTATVQAIAIDGGNSSAVGSATYTVSASATPAPTFTPPSGSTLTSGQTVTIADTDTNATIYYTTDGNTPSAQSTAYSGPIALTANATINAIAIDSGNSSQVSSATYTVSTTATPAPTFTPASGATLPVGQTVTIADSDTSATIYYTTDGKTTPTAQSTAYTAPIALTSAGTATIMAIAIDNGNSSAVANATYTVTSAQTVPAPTFTPASGATITAGQTVTLMDGDASATIYYTTDGTTTPTAQSTKYTAPVVLQNAGPVTIMAIAIDGSTSSTVAMASYTVTVAAATPAFNPASGTITTGQAITITETDTNATVYYTTDGKTTPTAQSTKYTAPFSFPTAGTVTVKAIAIDGAVSSPVATTTFTVTAGTAPPTFTPTSGATITTVQTVAIADTDTKATIYYTTDGTTTPTAQSTKYTAPFTLSAGSVTVKAIAIDGANTSPVATATYTVTAPTAAPTFTPASGATVTTAQTVTIADTDTKATIYYTTDGTTTPTAQSTKYTAPFTLSAGSVTVKAIAIDGASSSPVATATYTVTAPATAAPTFTPASGGTLTTAQTVTIADTDTKATIYYTTDGTTTPTAQSTKYTAPFKLSAGSVTVMAIAIDGANSSPVATATYTVTAAAPGLNGTVLSGKSAVDGAQVQLYLAGSADYGMGATALGSAVTTDTSGAFSVSLTCPAATLGGDLVYLVATGGNSGNGANASLELMTALGHCNKISTSTAIVVNEVTTVASAYALSPFMTTAPTVGASSTNAQGLSNAFATVNNLVDITSGKALTITPAYAGNAVALLNSSTVPQARIDTLANALNSCAGSNGTGGSCSGLFGAATPTGGTAPANTLQAILNIAQNPGTKVSAVYSAASASGPFQPVLGTAPTDWTLALTFTGGGLGISPNIDPNATATVGGQTFTGIAPTINTSLAIDATGNVWVAAYGENNLTTPSTSSATAPLLAEFNNQGAPLTPVTKVSTASPPVVTYGGFNPESTNPGYALNTLAIDPSGNAWVGDSSYAGNLFAVTPQLSLLPITPIMLGNPAVNTIIDGSGSVWASNGNQLSEFQGDGTITFSNVGGSSPAFPSTSYINLSNLIFDSNANLWGTDNGNATSGNTVYQINSDGTIAANEYPTAGGMNLLTLVADGSGNIYGCGDPGGQTLDVFSVGAAKQTHALANTRGCGNQLVLDGLGHIFAVSSSALTGNANIDEFTTTGVAISPSANGYTGTSSGEPPTLNPDPNYYSPVPGISAAIDGSGNLWVLNNDTNGATPNGTPVLGNVLVEYVGIAAPVVTPTSAALANGPFGARP